MPGAPGAKELLHAGPYEQTEAAVLKTMIHTGGGTHLDEITAQALTVIRSSS
jgi:hypothetical protein